MDRAFGAGAEVANTIKATEDTFRNIAFLSNLKFLKLDALNPYQCTCCVPRFQYPGIRTALEGFLGALETSRQISASLESRTSLGSDNMFFDNHRSGIKILETLVVADCPVTRYGWVKSRVKTIKLLKKFRPPSSLDVSSDGSGASKAKDFIWLQSEEDSEAGDDGHEGMHARLGPMVDEDEDDDWVSYSELGETASNESEHSSATEADNGAEVGNVVGEDQQEEALTEHVSEGMDDEEYSLGPNHTLIPKPTWLYSDWDSTRMSESDSDEDEDAI